MLESAGKEHGGLGAKNVYYLKHKIMVSILYTLCMHLYTYYRGIKKTIINPWHKTITIYVTFLHVYTLANHLKSASEKYE